MNHHTVKREVAPGVWEVARPVALTSPVEQWRRRRECRREYGHCWHAAGFIEFFCCMCGADVDGMPAQNCGFCNDEKAIA